MALAQLDRGRRRAVHVDDVADAAGVSRSLVYAYFGDRNGLAAEAYVRILDRLDRELGFDLPRDAAALRRSSWAAACRSPRPTGPPGGCW